MSELKTRTELLDAEIEEMEKAMYGEPEEDPSTDVEEVASDEESVETEEEAVEAEETAEVEAEEFDVEAAEAEETEETEEEKPKRVQWKKKFEELEVRYKNLRTASDNKLFRLRQQVTSMSDHIERLEDEVELAVSKLADVTKNEGVDLANYLSPEDKEIFGEQAINALTQATNDLVKAKVEPLQDELNRRKKNDRQVAKERKEALAQQAAMTFKNNLRQLVPNLDEVDTDPGFGDYVNEIDPFTGETRLYWLKKAQAAGDVERVAHFFNEYIKLTAEPENILEKKITPVNRPDSGEQRPPQQKVELIPYSVVETFHDDVTKGKYRNDPDELSRLDKKYDRAWREGRIDFYA